MAKKIKVTEDMIEKDIQINNNDNKKKEHFKIYVVGYCVLSVFAIIFLVLFYNNKINKLEKSSCAYNSYYECYDEFNYEIEKANFLDENIVFVLEGYGNFYYTYDCVKILTNGTFTYYAYNEENAIANGYIPGTC